MLPSAPPLADRLVTLLGVEPPFPADSQESNVRRSDYMNGASSAAVRFALLGLAIGIAGTYVFCHRFR